MNRDRELVTPVILASIRWWRNHRPVGWSEEQHLANPTINVCDLEGGPRHDLARAVAAFLSRILPQGDGKEGSGT